MLRNTCPEDILTEDTIRYGYKDTAPDLNISEQNESTLTLLGGADARALSAGTLAAIRKVGITNEATTNNKINHVSYKDISATLRLSQRLDLSAVFYSVPH